MSLWSKLVLFTCLQVSRRRLNLTETSPSFSPHKCAPPQVFLLVEIPLPPPWTELLMKKDEGFWFILSPLCPRLSLHVHPSLQPRPHFLLPLRPPCSCAPESPSGNAQACASPTPGSPRHLLWLPEPPWSDLSLVSRSPPDIPSRGPSISTPSLPWSSKAFCQEIFCPGSFFLLRCQHRCLLVLQGHPSTLPAHLTAHLQPHPPNLTACMLSLPQWASLYCPEWMLSPPSALNQWLAEFGVSVPQLPITQDWESQKRVCSQGPSIYPDN